MGRVRKREPEERSAGRREATPRHQRYLPFEGAGSASRWRIELPRETNHFDLNTISDVVIHLRYTAKEGGEPLKRAATEAVVAAASRTGVRLFSARHEFPGEWHRFLHPTETADPQSLQLELTPERFPFRFRGTQIRIDRVELFLRLKDGVQYPTEVGQQLRLFVRPPDAAATPMDSLPNGTLVPETSLDGMPKARIDVPAIPARSFGSWAIEAWSAHIGLIPLGLRVPDPVTVEGQPRHHLGPDVIEDVYVGCYFSGVATGGIA